MQTWAIGIDLGGTKIECAIVNNEGKLLDRLRIATQSSLSEQEIVENILDCIKKLSDQHPDVFISAIGIGVAGQIEKQTGIIISAPNLNWRNIDLQRQIQEKIGKPVAICNDVKAAALGEWHYGAGVGCKDMVCLFIGTGIGGAIIANGEMLEGANNTAGEIGHTVLMMNGPLCHCGNKGCFEALAGGWAIERDAKAAVQTDKIGGALLLKLAKGDLESIKGPIVTLGAQQDDSLAITIMDKVAEALIAGITSIVNSVGPERVVLGGGVIEGMPELIERVAKGMQKTALKAAAAGVEILPAKLHNDAGVVGASVFALNKLKKL